MNLFHGAQEVVLVFVVRYWLELGINLAEKLLDEGILDAFLLLTGHSPLCVQLCLVESHKYKIIHGDSAIIVEVEEFKQLPHRIDALLLRLITSNFLEVLLAHL